MTLMVTLQMKLHRRTDRAILASTIEDEADTVCLPLDMAQIEARPDGTHNVSLPEWLATREGLV